jgi:hypothetical protein
MSIPHQVFAIRYAERGGRRPEHFAGGDPHDATMPMDYFARLIRGGPRAVLLDIGFGAAVAARADVERRG